MVVSGSMMLLVSQAPSICTGGVSSSHHKKFENSLSTEEEDLVPTKGSSYEKEKSPSFCRLLVIKLKNKKCDLVFSFYLLFGLSSLRPTCFAGLTRRDPLKDEPAAVRDETGRINMFDVPNLEYTIN
ncbi:hypothetical protein Bca101_076009 [Brassica carinata]